MTQLEPCPHCHRHVKISETACPFCACSLADVFANRRPRPAPRARLGRAATFAFGLVAMSQGACGDDTIETRQDAANVPADARPDAPPDVMLQDASFDGGEVPIYAAAPTPTPKDGTTSRG